MDDTGNMKLSSRQDDEGDRGVVGERTGDTIDGYLISWRLKSGLRGSSAGR